MTAALPEQPPRGAITPTPEELDAFLTRRYASHAEILQTWFAIHGHPEIRVRQVGPAYYPDAATG